MPRALPFLLVAAVLAGCASSGSSGAAPPNTAPTVTHAPSASPSTSPASHALTGLGATKAAWTAAHDGFDVGAFSGILTAGTAQIVYDFSMDLPAQTETEALTSVERQLPSDARVVRQSRARACDRVFLRSRQLGRMPGVFSHGIVSVYLYTGYANGPLDRSSVDNVIVDNDPHVAAC